MTTATADYLFDMPQPEKLSGGQILRAELARYKAFSQEHDGAIYPAQAAVAMGVSNQRVLEMIEQGQLTHMVFFNRKVVSAKQVLARMDGLKGKPGRLKKAVSLAVDMTAAAFK